MPFQFAGSALDPRARENVETAKEGAGWLADALKTILGTAKLPIDLGADALRNTAATLTGSKLREPMKYTFGTAYDVGQAADRTLAPVGAALQKARRSAMGALDAESMFGESGVTPTAGGALPMPVSGSIGPNDFPTAPVRPALARVPAGRPAARASARPGSRPAASVAAAAPDTYQNSFDTGQMQGLIEGQPEPMGALAQPAEFVGPRQTLEDKYKQAIANLPKEAKGELTPEQKKRLELEFFLGLMARSSRPGAYALGAAGEAGLDVSGRARRDEEKNMERSAKSIAQQREDAYRQVVFGDKDTDNDRLARQEAALERRYAAGERRADAQTGLERERLGLLRQQIEQGKWSIQDTANGFVKIDRDTGRAEPLLDDKGQPIKPYRKPDDNRPAEVRLIEYLSKNPQAMAQWEKMNAKREGAITPKDLLGAYSNAVKDFVGGTPPTFQEWVRSTGIGQAAPSLPPGVPAGSKQVGTSKGKPVYQTPDGKRVIVE